MRIISPFRDYYDGAAQGDDRPRYVRNLHRIDIRYRFKGHGNSGTDWIHGNRGLVQSLHKCLDFLVQRDDAPLCVWASAPGKPGVVGIAGTVYFGRRIEHEVNCQRKTFFVLNSAADAYAPKLKHYGPFEDWKELRKATRKSLRRFPDSAETDAPFLALDAPVFTAHLDKDYAVVTANAKLPAKMAAVVDPWTAAVNIENYLGTVLVKQEDPEPEGLTDALRAHYAGHDPVRSFRNMPR